MSKEERAKQSDRKALYIARAKVLLRIKHPRDVAIDREFNTRCSACQRSRRSIRLLYKKLGFVKTTDLGQGPDRFLSIALNERGTEIVLMNRKAPSMIAFKVDDCKKTIEELKQKGVAIIKEPEKVPFGIQAIIADPDGNQMVLVEHPKQ
jgi:hypothetical protein